MPQLSPHRLRDQLLGRLAQEILTRQPANGLDADLKQDRNRKRRHPIQSLMPDSPPCTGQELAEPGNIQKPRGGILPGGLEQDMPGVMAAENVVDEIS